MERGFRVQGVSMAIEGLKGIFGVPSVKKKDEAAPAPKRQRKKKPKKDRRKGEEGKDKNKKVDIRI